MTSPSDTTPATIAAAAADLPALFEAIARKLFGLEEEPDAPEGFVAGFAVRAADLPALLGESMAEIAAHAAEHEAALVDCAVSGVMRVEEGYRAWGFLTLVPGDAPAAPTIADVSIAQHGPGGWRAEVVTEQGRGTR